MRNVSIWLFVLLFIAPTIAPAGSLKKENPKTRVENKVPIKAYPFDLQDVRLLHGPFRDASRRDQKYLLDLDPDRLLHNFRITAGLPSSAKPYDRGSEGRRAFAVLVGGEKIATVTLENHPGELFDFEYPLPERLTRGRQRITVKFQAPADSFAGSVFDVRVVQ